VDGDSVASTSPRSAASSAISREHALPLPARRRVAQSIRPRAARGGNARREPEPFSEVTGRPDSLPSVREHTRLDDAREQLESGDAASELAALRQQVDELRQAVRARDDFLAIAAHELRNPRWTRAGSCSPSRAEGDAGSKSSLSLSPPAAVLPPSGPPQRLRAAPGCPAPARPA
jgi:hypothetical protein